MYIVKVSRPKRMNSLHVSDVILSRLKLYKQLLKIRIHHNCLDEKPSIQILFSFWTNQA